MLYKLSSLILPLFLLTACTEPPYKNINNAQLRAMLKQGVPVYDVRRDDEWKRTGVIKGSRLLTIIGKDARVTPNFMPDFTSVIDKNSPVILICRTGNRTRKLAAHLVEEKGYTNIYNVRDGISQWIKDGNPVAKMSL